MRRAQTDHAGAKLPDSYEVLCQMHMPRRIKDDVDYDNTVEIVNRLAVLPHRTQEQNDYLETLTVLIEVYDKANVHIPESSPLDALKYLMGSHEMNASDLGRLLGNRPLGSAILRGERQISKENALKLAAHFKVNVGLFIQ